MNSKISSYRKLSSRRWKKIIKTLIEENEELKKDIVSNKEHKSITEERDKLESRINDLQTKQSTGLNALTKKYRKSRTKNYRFLK